MAPPLVFETVTDSTKGGELIHKYIRQRRVEYPDDLADLLTEIGAELLTSVDACHRADFLFREQGNKKEATVVMNEVMAHITAFKSQFGSLMSQADYCLQGVRGNRMADKDYQHDPSTKSPLLPATEIARCLAGLAGDFVKWEIVRRTGGWVLTILTQSMQVADPRYDVVNDFGPFSIELNLNELARGVRKPYRIIPQNPNIVSGYPDTPHPHVKTNQLCEGEGESLIIKSLKIGDIRSFAIVVGQILSTYNPGSPFLRLEYWSKRLTHGPNPRPHASFGDDESRDETCAICEGDESSDGEMYSCQKCGTRICSECSTYCEASEGRTLCTNCLTRMRNDSRGCRECRDYGRTVCVITTLTACADCGNRMPTAELTRCPENRYVCPNCFITRRDSSNPCCSRWQTVTGCPYRSHWNATANGFADTPIGPPGAPTMMQAEAAAAPRPRGNDDEPRARGGPATPMAEGQADDGIGGFGPPGQ